ncbi:hypothetical protein HPB48_004430 [Haemaphysalis longicornis]|uniref:Uncharacterized protein n=1 Tax=Haemaphysalis longicornis TaxID=44386 RepID=A0A9J6FQK6_HAELO|nr:hypothetical protein HPB48_004430 [Haemaphysalis longicornis]
MEPVSPESSWPTEEESSDCGCRFSSSSVEETPRHSEAARLEPNQSRGREGAETGERSGVDDHDGVEEGDGPHRQLRAQLFMTANVVPLFRDRLPQLKKKEREESWNESHFEFLSPRLVRNGSRAVLCFYDRRAHLLPPPYAFFPRQMAMRYCTHAVYHAPFALHEGRLAYRNPEFDRHVSITQRSKVSSAMACML